jgi:hypothetical protein
MSGTLPTPRQARGRVAAFTRSRSANDPEMVEARRVLVEATLTQHIKRVVAEAPPLTPEQVARITAALGGAK